jgi:hypothetical protein
MAASNNQITAPRVDFLDERTGKISREWYMFLYNVYTITGSGSGITAIQNGGTGASTASEARTNLGLGTIATQDANNVALTGGLIDGTTVGATTASTGAFTTLSASSTVSGTGFSTYLASPPAIGGTTPAAGTFTTLISNSTAQFGKSSVNYLQAVGAATGSSPVLSSIGSDADIDLTLTPKGAGRVNITTSIKPKVNSTTSVASPLAWNSTSYDEYALTALANALTISADANTAPADGQRMIFRFKDNGTAQALTWTTGSARAFRVVGVTLPTTTVANKLLYVGCIYNAADSRWDAIAVGQEA